MDSQFIQNTIDLMKLIAVLFAIFQFFLGLIVTREVVRMNSLIKSSKTGLIYLLAFFYAAYLFGVLVIFLFI